MLFTDVEGSTRLLDELGPERYASVLMAHRERLRSVADAHGGVEMGTEGDAFFFVFQSAGEGLAAAGEMQSALADGPLRVRMGVHSGEVLLVGGDYFGMAVHKAARISSAAHGGQVVVSAQTRALADVALRDLGEHRLKDRPRRSACFSWVTRRSRRCGRCAMFICRCRQLHCSVVSKNSRSCSSWPTVTAS